MKRKKGKTKMNQIPSEQSQVKHFIRVREPGRLRKWKTRQLKRNSIDAYFPMFKRLSTEELMEMTLKNVHEMESTLLKEGLALSPDLFDVLFQIASFYYNTETAPFEFSFRTGIPLGYIKE